MRDMCCKTMTPDRRHPAELAGFCALSDVPTKLPQRSAKELSSIETQLREKLCNIE